MVEKTPITFVESNPRDQKKFADQLSTILALFERAREWADLSNCLQKLKKVIDQYPNEPVPVKKELAKRLAQCLNPDLNVIHAQTIEVYQHIFARETDLMQRGSKQFEWGPDLGLFYSGLFNFYQYAAFEVKRKFLDFVTENVLKLEKELLISLPGFLLCMIPALEDQNSELLRRVERILQRTEEIVGTSRFFGEIWKTMLKSPRARLSAIKFLDRKIPKTVQIAQQFAASPTQGGPVKIHCQKQEIIIRMGEMIVESQQDQQLESGSSQGASAATSGVSQGYEENHENLPEWAKNERMRVARLSTELNYEDYCYFYYPNRQNLVVNAILTGLTLGENPIYVNRATFDFLITHMPITGQMLTEEEKIRILEGAFLNLKYRDFASHKKFFAWFQGHLEEEEMEPDREDPAIRAFVPALRRIFLRFKNVKTQSKQGFAAERASVYDIWTPLQLLLTLFDQNLWISKPIILATTVDLIQYIKHFYQMEDVDEKSLLKFKADVNNYFSMIKSELQTVWDALGDFLSTDDQNENGEVLDSEQALERQIHAIDLIAFCLRDLNTSITSMDVEQDLLSLQTSATVGSAQSFNDQTQQIMKQFVKVQSKQLIPILSKLLTNLRKLSNDVKNLERVTPALDLISQILQFMGQRATLDQIVQIEGLEELRLGVEDFNSFYVEMSEYLLAEEAVQMIDLEKFANFRRSSQILCKLQLYANPTTLDQMPSWLQHVIQTASRKQQGSQRILLTSVEILLDLIEDNEWTSSSQQQFAKDRQPDQQQISNIVKLQQLIIPDSASSSKKYGEISDVSPEQVQMTELEENFENQEEPLNNEQNHRYPATNPTNYCMNIIQTLWSLLGDPGDHQSIVQLLKRFDLLLPQIFSDVVTQELNSSEREIKNHSVTKFSIFWKLTAADIKEYIPFQPESERRGQISMLRVARIHSQSEEDMQFGGGMVGSADQSNELVARGDRSYVALHNMLLILDDKDPTLRLKCRSWLQESRSTFQRILDPLLREFFQNNSMVKDENGRLFYHKIYESDIVIENFTKLRNIILTTQDQFSNYVATNRVSDYIRAAFEQRQELFKDANILPYLSNGRYIQAIVFMTLSYIMGQSTGNGQENQYLETQVVKASASEFMELVLNSIKELKDLSREVKHLISLPLIRTLRQAIDTQNDAEQVHLLNLLRTVLFQGEFWEQKLLSRKDEQTRALVSNAKSLFEEPQFLQCLVDGMKNQDAFVRLQFITFVQKTIPLLKEIVGPDRQVDYISTLFSCFCDLLHCCDVAGYARTTDRLTKKKAASQQAMHSSNTTSSQSSLHRSYASQQSSVAHQQSARAQQDSMRLNNSSAAAARQSRSSIGGSSMGGLGGAGFAPQGTNNGQNELQITQENDIVQIIEGFKVILKDCLKIRDDATVEDIQHEAQLKELGKKTGDQSDNSGWLSFFTRASEKQKDESETQTVKRALFEQISGIILGCLNCWNDLDIFRVREYYFTRLGIFPYYAQDDRRMDMILKEFCRKHNYYLNYDEEMKEYEKQQQAAEKASSASSGNSTATGGDSSNKNRKLKAGKTGTDPKTLSNLAYNGGMIGNRRQLTLSLYMEKSFNSIQGSIVQFFEPLSRQNPTLIVQGFLDLWKASSHFTAKGLNKNESCEKLIQMLLSMQLAPHVVISAINEWISASGYQAVKQKREVLLDADRKNDATLQSLICHLVYTYLAYSIANNFHMSQEQKAEVEREKAAAAGNSGASQENKTDPKLRAMKELNDEAAKFFKNFSYSRYPTTICWLLEILLLVSIKFTPVALKMDKKHKSEFSGILEDLLEKAAKILSDSFGIRYSEQYGIDRICFSPTVYEMVKRYEFIREKVIHAKSGIYSIDDGTLNENIVFDRQTLQSMDEIPLQKENMFHNIEIVRNRNALFNSGDMTTFMSDLNNFLHSGGRTKINEGLQRSINKVFVVVTLRQILTKLSKQIHFATDDNRNHSEQIIVKPIMQVLHAQISDVKNCYLSEVHVYAEFLADILACLAENQHFCRQYKSDLTSLFYHENFFLMSERTLRKWQTTMRHFSLNNDDIVEELLLKFNQVGGLFTTRTSENKQKAYTFKRLAFLIYSADLDRFDEQLDNLLKKMTEGFKNPQKDREMRMQLFLLSRIIMLRLQSEQLAEALKKLWPHLLAELVLVFDVPADQQRDYWLTIEAIKIVELMSQLNIEDFQQSQWMFLFDGYGIQYRGAKTVNDNSSTPNSTTSANNEDDFVQIKHQRNKLRGVFQPYLVKFMCNKSAFDDPTGKVAEQLRAEDFIDYSTWQFDFYKVDPLTIVPPETNFSSPTPIEQREQAFSLDSKPYENNDIKMDSRVVNRQIEAEVFKYAYQLQDLLTSSNTKVTKIDKEGADARIERDFLKKPRHNI